MNRFVVLAATVGAALLLIAPGAQGFKPYTHNYTGKPGTRRRSRRQHHDRKDASTRCRPEVVAGTAGQWPTYYNAG